MLSASCRLLDTSESSILGDLLKDWGDKIEWSSGHESPAARRAYPVATAIYKAGLLKATGSTAGGAASGSAGSEPRKSKQVGGEDFCHGDNMPRGLAHKLPSYITAAYAGPEGGDPADTRSPHCFMERLAHAWRGGEHWHRLLQCPVLCAHAPLIVQIIRAHDAMAAATRATPQSVAMSGTHARVAQTSRVGREQPTARGSSSVGSSLADTATTTPARPRQFSGTPSQTSGASARAPVSEI